MATDNHLNGVSVHWLQTGLIKEIKNNGKDEKATIDDLEDLEKDNGIIRQKGENITCNRDCNFGAAYVDCLVGEDNVGPLSIVILISWKNNVGDIVDTLVDYCLGLDLDPKRTYIWIDFLCNNLHRIAESKQKGNYKPREEFEKIVEKTKAASSKNVKLLCLMSPWYKPLCLTSTWCIYEMYQYSCNDGNSEINLKNAPCTC